MKIFLNIFFKVSHLEKGTLHFHIIGVTICHTYILGGLYL